ncbi:MAG: dTDP-4-amino-4,6-dideoxygalactose transaminase [Candidatus Hydrogenedens sp.]|jgi:dTDP-4-amino-4,6-dideoxygalactose transaminase|nr:dTDP-4-amino-4,6-dideoxygalactose transaminase [Candidatus Hydrogenedens sp.]
MTSSLSPIPFNRPYYTGRELDYIRASMEDGHIAGDGPFTKKCHAFFEERFQVKKALLTTSCTDALEMSSLLCRIGPGDEVIAPSFTFVSSINAFMLHGARPVFADIREDTLNIDESQVEGLITEKTKAIVAVHYAGVGCEMDALMALSKRYDIPLIEDNAHALAGKYKGRYLGTFGATATQSFHETKNFTSGEGGALLINDESLMERAEIIREKGTDRSRFFRGQVDKYSWVDLGSSFLPSDMLAAFLYAQLESLDEIQERRRRIWEGYKSGLKGWAEASEVKLPQVPAHCEQTYHMFYMLMPSLDKRQEFIAYLKEKRILAVFHYLPLHLSTMGKALGGKEGDCPVTEEMSDRLVRLPFYTGLTEEDQHRVMEAVKEFS